jgi:hypothetical protein
MLEARSWPRLRLLDPINSAPQSAISTAQATHHMQDAGKVHGDLSDAIGPIAATYAPLAGCSVWNLSVYLSIYLSIYLSSACMQSRESAARVAHVCQRVGSPK